MDQDPEHEGSADAVDVDSHSRNPGIALLLFSVKRIG
jgi:hypothetical protein